MKRVLPNKYDVSSVLGRRRRRSKIGSFRLVDTYRSIYISTIDEHPRCILKVISHPLYSMNNFVTKLPQDGAQIVSLYGIYGVM